MNAEFGVRLRALREGYPGGKLSRQALWRLLVDELGRMGTPDAPTTAGAIEQWERGGNHPSRTEWVWALDRVFDSKGELAGLLRVAPDPSERGAQVKLTDEEWEVLVAAVAYFDTELEDQEGRHEAGAKTRRRHLASAFKKIRDAGGR